MARNAYTEVFQFFAPHVFFNLAVWGMRRLNRVMAELKREIERAPPGEFRADKDAHIERLLRAHGAWDAGLSVQANLELLDVLAFGLADFYQEYRNRLFFAEDVLAKHAEETAALERRDARRGLETARRLWADADAEAEAGGKTRFEQMAEDMGLFFEPEPESPADLASAETDLAELKRFLRQNGLGPDYLETVGALSEARAAAERDADARFEQSQREFGRARA